MSYPFNPDAFDRHHKAPPAWQVLPRGRASLDAMLGDWKLPPAGVVQLLEVLQGDPVSYQRPTPKSVAVHVPSSKMRRIIQCASRTVEYVFAHTCEFARHVLIYLDQPLTIKIWIRDRSGRRRRVSYTCDFLLVCADGVYVYECKDSGWLRKQSDPANHPYPRYTQDPQTGTWHHRAAEEAFAGLGFRHRVFHSEQVNVQWLANVLFVQDFVSVPPPAGVDNALEALKEAGSFTFFEARQVPGTTRETWYWLIAGGKVAFDLESERLDRPDLLDLASVHYSHPALLCHRIALDSRVDSGVATSLRDSAVLVLDPGRRVLYRDAPHVVLSRDEREVLIARVDDDGEVCDAPPVVLPVDAVPALVDSGRLRAVCPTAAELVAQHSRRLLACASTGELRAALSRWEALCEYRSTGKLPKAVKRRTMVDYSRWAKEASRLYGCEFLGMLRLRPGAKRIASVSPQQAAVLREVCEAFHRGKYPFRQGQGAEPPLPSRRGFTAAHADYVRLSSEQGVPPCSSRTLRRELKRFSVEQSELARRGKRASDKHAAPVGRISDTLPVHGSRPFQVAHVDHQVLDVWCVSGATGAVLGRPWLTLIFDAWSRMPLGYVLRFDPPSVFSVMLAIHDCVQRHNRFPDSLVSDQGSEFDSPDLAIALAYLRTDHIRRPPSKPRFGSLIERVFGSIKTRLIDELLGAIDTVARSRELTSSHDPMKHAVWTLASLSKLLEQYLFQTYPELIHADLGTTPSQAFDFGMEHAGERVARHVRVDDTFSLALSETVPGDDGRRKVPKSVGPISVCRVLFQHPDFSFGDIAGTRIPVRRTPADASFVYVRLPRRPEWERAHLVPGPVDLTNSSWRQARALVEENARQRLIASLPDAETANARVLSDLLLSVDAYERQALDRRREIDSEQAVESELRSALPSEPHLDVPLPALPDPDTARSDTPPAPGSSTTLRSYDDDDDE